MRTLLLCALLFMAAAASSGGLLDVVDRVEGQVTLSLSFDGARVQEGAALRPNVTRSAPAVTFAGTTLGAFYTLMELDPDAPDPANPQLRSYLHWLVLDIPGASSGAAGGRTVVKYRPSTPPVGTHRYIFLLFQQPRGAVGEAGARQQTPPERTSFDVRAFARQFGLGVPVGVASFVAAPTTE
jgi:hypothetical protein